MLRYHCAPIAFCLATAIFFVGCNGNPSYDATSGGSLHVEKARSNEFSRRYPPASGQGPEERGDQFAHIVESGFVRVDDQPLSTFSIDVDTASYSKARMFLLQQNMLPPADSVRIEEFLNYFVYDDAPPTNGEPFAIHLEVADCPWRPEHRLARVAVKGKELEQERPACNLVFLIDVSGSMSSERKLGLVQECMQLLVKQLNERDTVAVVVYAGSEGLVLPPTSGDRRSEITTALDKLHAGGSTNGGAGIQLAYSVAKQQHIAGGVNRVILCTDGDFNVGLTSPGDLVRLAQQQAAAGVDLTVLGVGMGNHNDALLEEISNKANGTYAFVDSLAEGRKVLIDQIASTLVTIARDVKIQVEFNPTNVAVYRLLGYENRRLENQDFNDDRKDAGEVGAGHLVTALYELVPAGAETAADVPRVDRLKYQETRPLSEAAADELFTLKLRYKRPGNERSELVTQAAPNRVAKFANASNDFRFASSVGAFAMVLRRSEWSGDANLEAVREIAAAAIGKDPGGYRQEFLQLVDAARSYEQPVAARETATPKF